MKVLIVLAALAAVASAGNHYGGSQGAVSTGSSSQFRSEDNYGNYNFGYDEQHATGGSSRREEMSNGVQRGSYALSDADGRRRIVNYYADETGFHAEIQTNEPGVEAKDPADVIINRAANAVAASVQAYATPAPAPAPAPLAAPAPMATYSAPMKTYQPVARALPVAAPIRAQASYGQLAAPAYAQLAGPTEAPTPRAFSYSFSSAHQAAAQPAPMYVAQMNNGYQSGPRAQPIALATQAYAPMAATPRAFSYSYGSTHQAAQPAPAYQQRMGY